MTKKKPTPRHEWQPLRQVFESTNRASGVVQPVPDDVLMFGNDRYNVTLSRIRSPQLGWPDFAHLSISRRDRRPISDWRDLQRIKNEVCGPECEGVQLHPAESRLVDTANQYHLWVAVEAGWRFPIGFTGPRVVTNGPGRVVGAVQRPLPPDWTASHSDDELDDLLDVES